MKKNNNNYQDWLFNPETLEANPKIIANIIDSINTIMPKPQPNTRIFLDGEFILKNNRIAVWEKGTHKYIDVSKQQLYYYYIKLKEANITFWRRFHTNEATYLAEEIKKLYIEFSTKLKTSLREHISKFSSDPLYSLALNVEYYNNQEGKYTYHPIYDTLTLYKNDIEIKENLSIDEAFALHCYHNQKFNITEIARTSNSSIDETILYLLEKDLIGYNPLNKNLEPYYEFYGTNLKEKIVSLNTVSKQDPNYLFAIKTLENANKKIKDISYNDIKIQISSPFIPIEIINEFLYKKIFTDNAYHWFPGIKKSENEKIYPKMYLILTRDEETEKVKFKPQLCEIDKTPISIAQTIETEQSIEEKISRAMKNLDGRHTITFTNRDLYKAIEEKCKALGYYTLSTGIQIYELIEDLVNNKNLITTSHTRIARYIKKSEEEIQVFKETAAQDIKNQFNALFIEFLNENPHHKETIQKQYNDFFSFNIPISYVHPFTILNKPIYCHNSTFPYPLYQSQANAIFRILKSKNTMLAHTVGAGKTLTYLEAINEFQKQNNQKALISVPKPLLPQTINEINKIYPSHIFQIYDATTISNLNTLATFHIITHDQLIQIPPQTISQLFTMLVVDEVDYFKNIPYETQYTNIKGLNNSQGSKRAEAFQHICNEFNKYPEKKLVFATGTPISNSLIELYVWLKLLQPEDLKKAKISSIDSFINTFSAINEELEINVSGTKYKKVNRINSIQNIPELIKLTQKTFDIKTKENLEEEKILVQGKNLPYTIIKKIECKNYETLKKFQKFCEFRDNQVHQKQPILKNDNPLSILTDSKKATISLKMFDPSLPDYETNKVNTTINIIKEIYNRENPTNNPYNILVFIDNPKSYSNTYFNSLDTIEEIENIDDIIAENTQNTKDEEIKEIVQTTKKNLIYDTTKDLITKLIQAGIPEHEIIDIHGKNQKEKQKIIDDFNNGKIRILIGNTHNLGTGVNCQRLVKAIIHLDIPLRPRDIEQRNGRGIRQGNLHNEVEIYYLSTPGTYDIGLWNILDIKQKTISNIFKTNNTERSYTENYYENLKELAIENPLIKESIILKDQLKKLEVALNFALDKLKEENTKIQHLPELLEKLNHENNVLKKIVSLLNQDTDQFYFIDNNTPFNFSKQDDRNTLDDLIRKKINNAPYNDLIKIGYFLPACLETEEEQQQNKIWIAIEKQRIYEGGYQIWISKENEKEAYRFCTGKEIENEYLFKSIPTNSYYTNKALSFAQLFSQTNEEKDELSQMEVKETPEETTRKRNYYLTTISQAIKNLFEKYKNNIERIKNIQTEIQTIQNSKTSREIEKLQEEITTKTERLATILPEIQKQEVKIDINEIKEFLQFPYFNTKIDNKSKIISQILSAS